MLRSVFSRQLCQTAIRFREPFNVDALLGGFSKPSGPKNNRSPNRPHKGPRRENRPEQRKSEFRFECPTQNSKAAVLELISRVKACKTRNFVNFIDPEHGKPKKASLAEIINSMDFKESGLSFITDNGKDSLPIIKKVSSREMVQTYSDILAAQKEKELLEMGSAAARKAYQRRLEQERKKSSLKTILLSWSISVTDLVNQKRLEVEKRVGKGEKFVIYLADRKRSPDISRTDLEKIGTEEEDESAPNMDDVEWHRRNMIVEKLEEILTEANCRFDRYGSLHRRTVFNCTPPAPKPQETPAEPAVSAKELKKQRRLEKEKKKAEKKKEESVDVDSLYSLKIED